MLLLLEYDSLIEIFAKIRDLKRNVEYIKKSWRFKSPAFFYINI